MRSRIPWLLAAWAFTAPAQSIYTAQAVSAREFPVMAWGSSPADPEQLLGMREAGLNISGFCRAEHVDRVHAAGLSCFVSDKRINGYDFAKLPPEEEIRRQIAAVKKEVDHSPAVIGFYLRDEPEVALMAGLGKVAALLRDALPDKLPYVNLFPHRVPAARLGTDSYESYVRMLVKTVGQPFLSYDNYSLVEGEMLDGFFTNLEIIRRLALESKVPFWNCILANAHFNYMEPSDATFNIQVYSTLAYGGGGIQYFTYFTPQVGNYRLGAVDQFGNRTPTWGMLQRINNQIHALAPTLVRLRSTGVYHYPDVPEQCRPLSESRLIEAVEMTQRLVRRPAGARFLVGEFEDERKRPYFLVVNKDLGNSFRFRVVLKKAEGKLFRVSPYSGKEEPFGREMDWLAPGAGILFRVE